MLTVLVKSSLSLPISYVLDMSVTKRSVFNFPTVMVALSISSHRCVNICFIYLEAILLDAFKLRIVISSW